MTHVLKHQPLVSFKDSKASYKQLEGAIAELRKFKNNWIEIKTQIAFSVENFAGYEAAIYRQVLNEMEELEGGEG